MNAKFTNLLLHISYDIISFVHRHNTK